MLKKIKDSGHGDKDCVNLVFLAEGYIASQQAQFDADCAAKVAYFFADPMVKVDAFKFNVYSVFLASNQSGITNPTAITGQPELHVDTYFKCSFWSYGIQREVAPKSAAFVLQTMEVNIPASNNKINYLPILLCNTPYYMGAEVGSIATCSLHEQGGEVLLHEEAGHVIAAVGDEFQGAVLFEQRNNTQKFPLIWASIYSGIPVQRTYAGQTWYVPTNVCKMRALGEPFCVVCADAFHKGVNFYITQSGGAIPTAPVIPIPPTPAKPDLTLFPNFIIPAKQKIAPSTITTANPDDYRCLINWNPVPNCPNYIIQWSKDNGATWVSSTSNTGTSATITHLTTKTTYSVRMRCDYYNAVVGAFSPVQTITTL